MMAWANARVRSFVRSKRGAVAVFWALSMPLLIGVATLALDVGTFYLERRGLQAASDAAAMAAVLRPDTATETAREILRQNGYPNAAFVLSRGRYRADRAIDRKDRFQVDAAGPDVRIEAEMPLRTYFAGYFVDRAFSASVRSEARAEATLSLVIGTRLASLRDGAINAALANFLGTNVSAAALDYRGLAGARLRLGSLLSALRPGETEVADVKSIAESSVDPRVLLKAIAQALRQEGSVGDANLVDRLARVGTRATASISLADLVDLPTDLESVDVRYPSRALAAQVSVLSLVQGMIARNGIGNDFRLTSDLPGLERAETVAAIGQGLDEPSAMSIGWIGTTVEARQIAVRTRLATGKIVAALGSGLDVPIEAVVAGGSALVTDAVCSSDPAKRSVTLQVTPGLARVEIGEFTGPLERAGVADSLAAAQVAQTPLRTRVSVHAAARADDRHPRTVVFRGSEIGNGQFKTVSTNVSLGSIVDDLLRWPEITVTVIGLPLPTEAVRAAVASVLMTLAEPLEATLGEILSLAGIRLGEVDVRIDGMTCGSARLVG